MNARNDDAATLCCFSAREHKTHRGYTKLSHLFIIRYLAKREDMIIVIFLQPLYAASPVDGFV